MERPSLRRADRTPGVARPVRDLLGGGRARAVLIPISLSDYFPNPALTSRCHDPDLPAKSNLVELHFDFGNVPDHESAAPANSQKVFVGTPGQPVYGLAFLRE